MKPPRTLHVRVLDSSRAPLKNAKVRLSPSKGRAIDLAFDRHTGLHGATADLSGTFTLTVSATGLETQERTVDLPHPPTPEEFVLGKKGMPYYFRGRVKTPFDPKPQFVAVTIESAPEAATRVAQAARRLGLAETKTDEEVLRNNVRIFRYPAGSTPAQRQRLFESIRSAAGVRIAGPLVEMFDQRVTFLTSQFVVKYAPHVTGELATLIAREFGFRVVRSVPVAGNAFLLEGEPRSDYGLLDAANALAERDDVEYAEPNAVMTSILYQVNPTDFLAGQQWHIPLIDLPEAWLVLRNSNAMGVVLGGPGDRTFGDEDLQIVVFDTGIQTTTPGGVVTPTHPEFQGNVTSGAPKLAAVYDFINMIANNNTLGLGGSDHGMGCGGVAAALTNNPATVPGETEGVAGAAGNCRVVGVSAPFGQPTLRWADAFVWMAGINPGWVADGVTYPMGTVFPVPLAQGADIHTNSVRIPDMGLMDDALDFLATYGRGGRGMVSFLAAGNTAAPISNPFNNTIADHDKVITVAASINTDVRSGYSCFDPAIDICAPSNGDAAQTAAGAPGKVTTDTVGGGNLAGQTGGPNSYRNNFGGTSSATPLAAGVGALMLSINPDLNWVQVREILRNTAIKIDAANTDPVGQWTVDGMGNPVFSQWYGFGRVDADGAVIGARDFALASDVVIRDNLADSGAVPSGGWHADSPDIWVRRANDPIPVLAYGAAGPHENPLRGQNNFVFLRVRNTGTAPTNEVYLRALITHFPGFEFRYPTEWQPSTPPSQPLPVPLTPGSYLIGSVMIDDLGAGADIIVKMTWNQALVPPATVLVSGMPVNWHPCLLAEVSPHDGPGPSAPGSYDVKRYNDLAHKNITIEDPAFASDAFGVVAGTALREGVRSLVIDRRLLGPGARVYFRAGDSELMRHWFNLAREGGATPAQALPWGDGRPVGPGWGDPVVPALGDPVPGALTFLDRARVSVEVGTVRQLVVEAQVGTRIYCRGRGEWGWPVRLTPGRIRGHDVVFFEGGGADSVELPMLLRGGEYLPLAIGLIRAGPVGGVLRATQRLASGELSPGYEIRV